MAHAIITNNITTTCVSKFREPKFRLHMFDPGEMALNRPTGNVKSYIDSFGAYPRNGIYKRLDQSNTEESPLAQVHYRLLLDFFVTS